MKLLPPTSLAGLALMAALAASNSLPAADKTDGLPSPLQPVPVVYPYDLALAGTEGRAVVQFNIDATGITREATVVSADQPAFGQAAKGMIEAERFAPLMQDGKAVARTGLKEEVRFSLAGLSADTRAMLDELKKPQPDFAKPRELDTLPPKLNKYVNAVFPQSLLAEAGKSGEAVIECIIDRHGQVQLPRIVSATTVDCGWAAATAVEQWQFAPPTRGGKAVATRMQIPLEFTPPPAGAAK